MSARMRALATVAVLVGGCAPPEPPEVEVAEPAITIAYPPRDVGTVMRREDGGLEVLIVVDTDNITLTDPYVEGIVEVEGQGHWHATLGAVEGYQASFEPSLLFTLDPSEVTNGVRRLTVSLQTNLHDDLDQFDHWQSSIEFEVVAYEAPPPEDTGAANDSGL